MPSKKTVSYSVHPAIAMVQDWIAGLKSKTGRTLEEWIELTMKSGLPTVEAKRDWLKKEHGHGTNGAWWLAERSEGRGNEDGDPAAYLKAAKEYVIAMYAGPKAALKPIHDALIQFGLALGDDVKICPCTTIVPLYREHVFAQVKPSTLTRIDFGLALHDTKATGRLIDTGGFAKKDRITHRFAITSIAEIDKEVRHWLKIAYDMDAPGAAAQRKAARKPAAEVSIPADLQKALKKNRAAAKAFESMPPSHRREYIGFIEEAKKPETRARRIDKSIAQLTLGKRGPYG